MARILIGDSHTGLRPLGKEKILHGTFDGDICGLKLDNGCVIFDDNQANYHTKDGREFAEVIEMEDDEIHGQIIGYVEII